MAREKKITVKPFLNKELKSVGTSSSEDRFYPVYFRVTYDRKVTKFPSPGQLHFPLDKEENLAEEEVVKDIEATILEIIQSERSRQSDYRINGFGKRFKIYYDSLYSLIDYVNAALLRGKGFEVKSLPGRMPYPERLAAGILTVAADDKTTHELYYLARFLESQYPHFGAYRWIKQGTRQRIIETIERKYYDGDGDDYEYANRLTSGVRLLCSPEQLEKILDNIISIAAWENVSLFSDTELIIRKGKSECKFGFARK